MNREQTRPSEGSFEYIEELIRVMIPENAKGEAFEEFSRYFLERAHCCGLFKKVWFWNEWPLVGVPTRASILLRKRLKTRWGDLPKFS